MDTVLKIENLHCQVQGQQILKGLNLEIKRGEVHAIMGPNGSGKSTLSSVLAGKEDYEITAGQILYQNEDIGELSPMDLFFTQLGVKYQFFKNCLK